MRQHLQRYGLDLERFEGRFRRFTPRCCCAPLYHAASPCVAPPPRSGAWHSTNVRTPPALSACCISAGSQAKEEKPGPSHLELPEDIAALSVAKEDNICLYPVSDARRPVNIAQHR